ARSRLYVASFGQLLVVDAAPASPAFLQTLRTIGLGAAGAVNAMAVNSATNVVYVASDNGVSRVDLTPGAVTLIANTPAPSSEIAVDEAHNRVFAAGTAGAATTAVVIDGAANAVMGSSLAVPGVVNSGSTGKRLVVNAATGTAFLRTSDTSFTSGWVVSIDAVGPTATPILLGARDSGAVSIVSADALNRVVTTPD